MKEKAKNNWDIWRLIFDGGMSYSDVCNLEYEELIEANFALDLYIEKLKKPQK